MIPENAKTIRLGWIALDVIVDADSRPVAASVNLTAEKNSTALAALVFAQVAEVAEADLRRRVLGEQDDRAGHSAVCAMEGDAATCPCREAISSGSSSCDPEHGAH